MTLGALIKKVMNALFGRRDGAKEMDDECVTPTSIIEMADDPANDLLAGNEPAKQASKHEQKMSFRYTITYYHVAMLWAALMAAPIIMEGYETATVPNFFSLSHFKDNLGEPNGSNYLDMVIPTKWQAGITMAAASGQLFGLWLAPRMVNGLGYRISTVIGLSSAALFLLVAFFCVDTPRPIVTFTVGELLLGVPWGLLQGITLPYVSDITPLKLKGPATTMINVFWLVGQLISAGVLRAMTELNDFHWAIKIPILLQYAWLIPLVFVALFAPESPLYLSRNDKNEEAKSSLRRVTRDPLFNAQGSLDMIRAVNTHEKDLSQSMGFLTCLQGINLRRTEIAVVVYLTQQLVGTPLIFYSVKVLQKGGINEQNSLCVTVGMYVLCIMSTFMSMVAMRSIGRRAMWIGGLMTEIICLVAIGTMAFYLSSEKGTLCWVIAGFLVVYAAVYNFTIGPVCYTIVAETPSTRLKTSTNAIARALYILVAIANLFLVPNLLEAKPAGWGLGARAALVWAGTATLCLIWAWFRLPEMKDRTPGQIDILFEREVSARKWHKVRLD